MHTATTQKMPLVQNGILMRDGHTGKMVGQLVLRLISMTGILRRVSLRIFLVQMQMILFLTHIHYLSSLVQVSI